MEEIEKSDSMEESVSDLEKCDIVPGDMIILDFGLDRKGRIFST